MLGPALKVRRRAGGRWADYSPNTTVWWTEDRSCWPRCRWYSGSLASDGWSPPAPRHPSPAEAAAGQGDVTQQISKHVKRTVKSIVLYLLIRGAAAGANTLALTCHPTLPPPHLHPQPPTPNNLHFPLSSTSILESSVTPFRYAKNELFPGGSFGA